MGISVLMSVYAKEEPNCFKESLESIIHQTMLPSEIIIVKDGILTEALEGVIQEIVKRFPNIITYQFEENVRLGRALKKGLELCNYELVARMDTDDIACEDRLKKQYEYMMENPEIVVLGGAIQEFCDKMDLKSKKISPIGVEEIRKYAKYRNPVNHMTVMFRKSIITQIGSYRHFPFLEDYDLWGRVLVAGYKIDNLPDVLVKARVGKDLYSRRGGFEYCKNYLKLRAEQHRNGLTTVGEYFVACCITIAITLLPSNVRQVIYQKVLRK